MIPIQTVFVGLIILFGLIGALRGWAKELLVTFSVILARFIEMVFEILDDLQHNEGKTIVMVEQNAKKGLEFSDIGYVLVSGQLAMANSGDELLQNPEVGRLFLGG